MPTALVIVELSSRFPERGRTLRLVERSLRRISRLRSRLDLLGLLVFLFSRTAFRQRLDERLHRRAAAGRPRAESTFLLVGSFLLLLVAVDLNIVGLNIGKWLQNAGGVGTYVPLLMLVGAAAVVWHRQGSARISPGST